MPTYNFECGECRDSFECHLSFADYDKFAALEGRPCPIDGCVGQVRIVSHPVTVLDATPRTLGALAERNEARGGRYWVDHLRTRHLTDKRKAREQLQERLPSGMEAAGTTKAESPWWRPKGRGVNPSMAALTPQQKLNYIVKGDSRG